MAFRVVPSVHLERTQLLDYAEGEDVRAALTTLTRAHQEVYVVDVDGVRRNHPDLEFFREKARNLPVWVDAGSRYAADAMDVLVAGASTCTLRWNTLRHHDELVELADMCDPGTFLVGLEFTERGFLPSRVSGSAGPDEAARIVRDLGFGLVIHGRTFDATQARHFADAASDVWWYGHVNRHEALELQRLGYAGAIAPAALMGSLGSFEPPTPEGGESGTGEARP